MNNSAPRFDHEKLDVYHVAIKFVAWVAELAASLDPSAKFPRDQLLRSSQSIPQNIAEGNGKRTGPERRRYFEIARGSATESAATLDILVAIGACETSRADEGKQLAKRLVQMLVKLCSAGTEYEYENENERGAPAPYVPRRPTLPLRRASCRLTRSSSASSSARSARGGR